MTASTNMANKATIGILFILAFAGNSCLASGVSMYALINMNGVEGSFQFFQETPDSNVTIDVRLYSFKNEPLNYSWAITKNLISYSDSDRCNKRTIGNKYHDFTAKFGALSVGALADVKTLTFTDSGVSLYGPDGIWEKSILLEGTTTVCGNILSNDAIRVSEAVFTSPVAGKIVFRQIQYGSDKIPHTQISVDLVHVSSSAPTPSNHDWKILVTDILDTKSGNRRVGTCDHLTTLYDPDNADDRDCSTTSHLNCKKGDMTKKLGQIPVGAKRSRYSRLVTSDSNLPLSSLDGPRYLYVAIYNDDKSILSCAKIANVLPKETKVQFQTQGVRGFIFFKQQSPIDPTFVTVNLTNLRQTGVFYHVHKFPIRQRLGNDSAVCLSADDHFNPTGIVRSNSPAPANGTYDQYEIGDLSGKYGILHGDNFEGNFFDPYLTLYGTDSVVGRSVVIHKADSSRWVCSNIEYPREVVTAVATFFYPFAGRVIFRQDAKNSLDDTTVFVEYLAYVDSSVNTTNNHQWYVHTNKVSKDSLDWQNRCFDCGPAYNSYRVSEVTEGYKDCDQNNPFRCATGDLTRKYGRVNIAASLETMNSTRLFYTDVNLPLTGPGGVMGRSLVIQDDFAPDFRGKRMACTNIQAQYPSRAKVDEWHESGSPSDIDGQMIFEQATEYDFTTAKIKIKNLESLASGYHIHEVPVPVELSYPCTNDAVYAHYNPFQIDKNLSPSPGTGTADQYELGDLSGKYGTMQGAENFEMDATDANLPLKAPFSIIGRSAVIHKRDKDERWVCGDVKPFVKENAKRVQAIASFHHPKGFVYGYVKMGQVEFSDGSLSDTTVEISLRHPGRNNKNLTTGHFWGVHVNQVGEDQAVQAQIARCMAAGFRWNPYRVTSGTEIYGKLCTSQHPLNCEMGDLSGRNGPLTVGGHRVVFTDSNLPLVGNYSIMKKSIVIFDKNGDGSRFACANILPDYDIVQKIQIKKNGKGSGQVFIEKAREAMAVPEWMMHLDSGETQDYDTCMQYTIYFRGPDAGKLQQELDSILNSGYSSKRYATAPGDSQTTRKKFHFQLCSTAMDKFNAGSSWRPSHLLNFVVLSTFVIKMRSLF